MKTKIWIIGIIIALLFTSAAFSAYLEQDYEERRNGPVIRPPIRILPPPTRNEVTDLIDRISIGRPHSTRNMIVFPLYLSRDEDSRHYITLDDAIDRGYLKIYEKGSGTVSQIDMENRSDRYIFMMAGEILGGGKQNRVISKDVLLSPRGGIVSVPVYCVEQHRWASKGSMKFYSAKCAAPSSVRSLTQAGESQNEVWEEVDAISKANKVKSSSGNFQAVYEDKAVQKRIAVYDPLKRMPRHTVGVVVAINGRIVGAEIFCNEELFDDLWHKILKSYSLDAVSKPMPVREISYRLPRPEVTKEQVRRFLGRVYGIGYVEEEQGVDAGHFLNLSARDIYGKALIFRRAVIHLNLTNREHIIFTR